ncbi:hypothetical protein GYMLUDRAFT_242474 [Collybiopsis luxurians FD-317 M1]|uniref:Transmembrane protein n=1 Tax=Collybiopsis luxurians FD-317 M1 TaxID=944289 RepID=A0A0D0BFZ5_9AGAR|nr:hypothetical protein GYMLUDRAFT_242474 [Collybiopsis luxurians FD-317 M1]
MSTVWFMVDDTDPRIIYSNSWIFVPDTSDVSGLDFDSLSFNGPAFNSTLHSTTGNTTITFRFNGSYFGVYGSSGDVISNSSGFPSGPFIDCLLDNEYTMTPLSKPPVGLIDNNVLVCSSWTDSVPGASTPASDGEHELVIEITNYPGIVSGTTTAWYFDYITYESSANPLAHIWARMDELEGTYVTSTRIPGSEATVKFNGTSISLYGDLTSDISNTAAYQVDDQAPILIQLTRSPNDNVTLAKQLLFTASDLSVGEHTVVVIFNGTQSGMPLDIDYFYIRSLTAAQQESLVSSSTSSTTPTSTSTGSAFSNSSSAHLSLSTIVGAVLGSLVVVILLIVVIMWWRRSKRTEALATPIPFEPQGFITTALTSQDLASASSPHLRNSNLFQGPTNEAIFAQRSRESGPNTLLAMKYEQRIAVMQDQLRQQQDQQYAHYNAPMEVLP